MRKASPHSRFGPCGSASRTVGPAGTRAGSSGRGLARTGRMVRDAEQLSLAVLPVKQALHFVGIERPSPATAKDGDLMTAFVDRSIHVLRLGDGNGGAVG